MCWGTGLNAAVVDVEAYKEAKWQLAKRQDLRHRYSMVWIQNGVQVGVRFEKGDRLAVADFVRKQTTKEK